MICLKIKVEMTAQNEEKKYMKKNGRKIRNLILFEFGGILPQLNLFLTLIKIYLNILFMYYNIKMEIIYIILINSFQESFPPEFFGVKLKKIKNNQNEIFCQINFRTNLLSFRLNNRNNQKNNEKNNLIKSKENK